MSVAESQSMAHKLGKRALLSCKLARLRLQRLSLVLFMIRIAAPTFSAEAITISFSRIVVEQKGSNVWCEVSVKNESSLNCIIISQFTLESAIRNAWFHDNTGSLWLLHDKNIVSDPPPLKADYTLRIKKDQLSKVRVKFDFFGQNGVDKKLSKYPDRVEYICFGEVSAADCGEKKFLRLIAGGRGEVRIEARDSRSD